MTRINIKNFLKIFFAILISLVLITWLIFATGIFKKGQLRFNILREKEQHQSLFFTESLNSPKKETDEIEVLELSSFTHQMGNSYQLIVLIKRESGLLPERVYLVEKETRRLFIQSPINLSRFQTGCRESFNPAKIVKYETEFFKINQNLPFPEREPALKNGFFAVVVYHDGTGKRYFVQKEIIKICQIMME